MKKWMVFSLSILGLLLVLFLLGRLYLEISPRLPQRAARLAQDGIAGIAQASRISQIATSPVLPGVMFAGVLNNGGTPMYSLDSGLTWQMVSSLPWSKYYSPQIVAVTPGKNEDKPRLFVAGAGYGSVLTNTIFSISPGEIFWRKTTIPACPSNYTREYFAGLVVSPLDPERLYVTRYCDDLPTDWQGGITISSLLYEGFVITDSGPTFHRIYEETIRFDPQVPAARLDLPGPLIPSPLERERLYMGSKLVSNDGGQTWGMANFPVTTLVPDNVDADRLYGIQQVRGQNDTGLTRLHPEVGWKAWEVQPCMNIQQLVAHPSQTGVLFLRCQSSADDDLLNYPPKEALLLSADSGEHWQAISEWSGNWIGPDYGNRERILWARDDGLWTSDDLGGHWSHLTADYQADPQTHAWENLTPPSAMLDSELAVISPLDLWAGDMWGGLAHWDGTGWQMVSYPHTAPVRVYDLDFSASDHGWMVGEYNAFQSMEPHGIAYRWDGQTWIQAGPLFNQVLLGIDSIGDEAWAVGEGGLILHWDGASWTEMPNPVRDPYHTATGIYLTAITMLTSEEGWAVGGNPYGNNQGVILHYQDATWRIAYDTGGKTAEFRAVHMLSPDLGYAGGMNWAADPLLMRWDGQKWENVPEATYAINAISAASEQNVWISAGHGDLLHWDGKTWKKVDLPGLQKYNIVDLAMLPSGDLWLSTQLEDELNHNFILHTR